jgi:hypothetical protein
MAEAKKAEKTAGAARMGEFRFSQEALDRRRNRKPSPTANTCVRDGGDFFDALLGVDMSKPERQETMQALRELD